MRFTLGRYDIRLHAHAKWPWTHLKKHVHEDGFHWVWGKLSLVVEDHTIECHPVCGLCDSPDLSNIHYEDEGWLICNDCRTVEGAIRYVNKRQLEQL